MVGCNSRLDTIQAAILKIKLRTWMNILMPAGQPQITTTMDLLIIRRLLLLIEQIFAGTFSTSTL
jgi:hypothetical protein